MILLLGLALVTPVHAQDALPGPAPAPDAGHRVYRIHCMACHGELGDGQGPAAVALLPPPPDFTQPGFWTDRTPETLARAVRSGLPGGYPMVGTTQLTDPELDALVGWLMTLRPAPE